jgi:sugar phosphate isomerase/epimerase
VGRLLNLLGSRYRDAGLRLGYHNHAFEMATVDGKLALDWMLESTDPENLFFEPDLAWIVRGGVNPLELLERYQGRCRRIHVKDIAPAGQNEDEDGWADVGYGILDWEQLLPAAKATGAEWYIVEHDNPRDPVKSICRSMEFLRSRADLL